MLTWQAEFGARADDFEYAKVRSSLRDARRVVQRAVERDEMQEGPSRCGAWGLGQEGRADHDARRVAEVLLSHTDRLIRQRRR